VKWATPVCIGLFVAAVVLSLAQLWFHILDMEVFGKLLLTLIALGGLVFLPAFILRENRESEKRNKGGGLD
jgi:hypothetical protein